MIPPTSKHIANGCFVLVVALGTLGTIVLVGATAGLWRLPW